MLSLDDLQILKHNNYTIEICIPICVIYPPSKLMCLTFLFGCVIPISILVEQKLNSFLLHCRKHILLYLKFNVKKHRTLYCIAPNTNTVFFSLQVSICILLLYNMSEQSFHPLLTSLQYKEAEFYDRWLKQSFSLTQKNKNKKQNPKNTVPCYCIDHEAAGISKLAL